MNHYRVLRAWCIALTVLVTLVLLWLLSSVTIGVLLFMIIVACFEGFFLREASLQAQAKDEQRLRQSGGSSPAERLSYDPDRSYRDE